jgi:hypothetical protein
MRREEGEGESEWEEGEEERCLQRDMQRDMQRHMHRDMQATHGERDTHKSAPKSHPLRARLEQLGGETHMGTHGHTPTPTLGGNTPMYTYTHKPPLVPKAPSLSEKVKILVQACTGLSEETAQVCEYTCLF